MSATVHSIAAYRARRGIRVTPPKRVAGPAAELPTWFVCVHGSCGEISPEPGMCVGCKARLSAALVVRRRS